MQPRSELPEEHRSAHLPSHQAPDGQQERDQDILSLIPDDQRSKYELVQQYYSFKMDSLSRERERAFEQAVEQTKKILTPDQLAQWKAMGEKAAKSGGGCPFMNSANSKPDKT